MPHRQSDILLCYFALDASDATDILWLVVCTGVRFSVGCISGTHCFSFSMCALYKYEIQIVNSFMYTGFLLLLGDGGGTREKNTINSRSCAFCAVWHQLTTLFCTPDVSQANHDLYSGEILLPSKLCPNLCLQHRSTRRKTTFCGFTLGGLKLLIALQVVAFDGFAPQIVGSLLTTFAFILLHLQVLLHHSKQSSPMV